MKHPGIDILYLAHKRPEFTEASYTALRQNTDWSRVKTLHIFLDGDPVADAEDALMGFSCPDGFGQRGSGQKLLVWEEPVGGPVGAMRTYLMAQATKPESDRVEAFVKIDNDLVVCPGWLPHLEMAADLNPEYDLIGIEPWSPELEFLLFPELATVSIEPFTGYQFGIAQHRHVGGIGLFRLSAFNFHEGHDYYPAAERGGRFGWTEWQWAHPKLKKGFLNPPLPIFLLDHLPVEPWLSLSKRYVAEGVQRQPWAQYPPEMDVLWSWWTNAQASAEALEKLPLIPLSEAFTVAREAYTPQGIPDETAAAIEAAAAEQGFGLVPDFPSPWSDEGWFESDQEVKRSHCHDAKVFFSRGDGVSAGTCSVCHTTIVRVNPRTQKQEVSKEQLDAKGK